MKTLEVGDIIVYMVDKEILVLSRPRFYTAKNGSERACFIGLRHSNGCVEYFVLAVSYIFPFGTTS